MTEDTTAAETAQNAADELQKQREQEFRQRQHIAQARAQALSQLMLGEILQIDENTHVMSVPNGWIFTQTHKAGITSTFVPGMTAPPPQKKSPIIAPPH